VAGGVAVIRVLKPGLLTTVQDAGRPGWRAWGMPVAGAADRRSFALANLLAGNPTTAAALELTLLGPTLRFEADAYVALCGADLRARLDGAPAANGSGFQVRAGAELAFASAARGCRAYLAVRGGVDVPEALGRRAKYTRAGVGGFHGRAVKPGDLLPLASGADGDPAPRRLPDALLPRCEPEVRLRAILGPQEDRFSTEGVATFLSEPYAVTNRNDRMGYQLDGRAIRHRGQADIVSDALCPGAVQVPGSGAPIVMMQDAQTTGGYAKIAVVIGADLPLLAQARMGDRVRFARVGDAEAVAAARAERTALEEAARALA
jgi:biotin-dependent carboxylase-like uncharacterized protein